MDGYYLFSQREVGYYSMVVLLSDWWMYVFSFVQLQIGYDNAVVWLVNDTRYTHFSNYPGGTF